MVKNGTRHKLALTIVMTTTVRSAINHNRFFGEEGISERLTL